MKDPALKWLYAVPGNKKAYIVVLTVIQAISGASGVLYALLLRNAVDSAVDRDPDGFWTNVILLVLLVAGQLILRALIRWLTELSRSTFENIFKSRLNHTLLHNDYLRINTVHSGAWMNRLTNDTAVVANAYVDIVPGFAGMIVKLISALAMIIALEPKFAAIIIPVGILLLLFSWAFRKKLKSLHKNVQKADGNLRVFLQEHIGNMFMIRSFAAEDHAEEDSLIKMKEHQAARMKKNRFSNICNTGFGAAMNGMYILGVIWCGYGILNGTVTFGTLTAITQLIAQVQAPFANMTGFLPQFYAMQASAERLMEAEAFDGAGKVSGSAEEMKEFYNNELKSFGLSDVSFSYYPAVVNTDEISKEGEPEVLKHITLDIRKGEYVAFTGQSGCGKSTVIKLLTCVYPADSGEIYFKDNNGKQGELNSQYRRLFAYVPQGNALMSGTIREVVSFASPDAANDEKRLDEALTIACAAEFVYELPDGVDSLLGERGCGLSEGQMQRLAIARAVFAGSPVLLLDEATAALDSQTEKRLLRNLRNMTDKTVIIVTHRPAALEICDKVMEFTENGVCVHYA